MICNDDSSGSDSTQKGAQAAGLAIGMRADLDAMVSLARSVNPQALDDPALRERIARAHTDIEYTKLLNYRALSKILKNQRNWPEVPLAKLQWSHLAQTLAELAVDLLGPVGMMGKGAPAAHAGRAPRAESQTGSDDDDRMA